MSHTTTAEAPADRTERSGPGPRALPVLQLVRPLALLAAITLVLGRAVGPSAAGIGVGMARTTSVLEFAGDMSSQLLAIAATVLVLAEIVAIVKGGLALPIRAAVAALGGLAVMVALSAAARPIRPLSAGLTGAAAATLALLAAWDARRSPYARPAALVVGVVGAASLVRLLAMTVLCAPGRPTSALVAIGRAATTLSFTLDGCALAVAVTWVASRRRKVTTPATVAAVLGAFLLARHAVLSDPESEGPAGLLIRRAIERLLSQPEPYGPLWIQAFVAALAPLVAVAALFARGQVPALSGAIALALLVRTSPERPLGALALVIAASTLILASRDDRGVWAMIARSSGPTSAPR